MPACASSSATPPGGPAFDVARNDAGDGPGACCSFVHLETGANLLELLEGPFQPFSKRFLKSLNNQADFDSAVPGSNPTAQPTFTNT